MRTTHHIIEEANYAHPCWSHRSVDLNPVLNKLGRLILLLHLLGVQATSDVFSGKAGPYNYMYDRKRL